jgi:hypothetical protein
VEGDDRLEIDLGQDVAIEDDDRLVQRLSGVPHRSGCTERRSLDDVTDTQTGVPTVTEDLLDPPWLVVQTENGLVDLGDLPQ